MQQRSDLNTFHVLRSGIHMGLELERKLEENLAVVRARLGVA